MLYYANSFFFFGKVHSCSATTHTFSLAHHYAECYEVEGGMVQFRLDQEMSLNAGISIFAPPDFTESLNPPENI